MVVKHNDDETLEVRAMCPMCEGRNMIVLSNEEGKRFLEYKYGIDPALIQDALPMLNPAEREFVKTGLCPKCQEMMFRSGITSDRIHPID